MQVKSFLYVNKNIDDNKENSVQSYTFIRFDID